MATTVFLKRHLGALRAADRESEEALATIPHGVVVKAVISQPRNINHHRKYFALLNAVFPHQDLYPTMETFAAAMKCACGLGETVKLPDGRTMIVPGSIAFAKMDQAAFDQFYQRAEQVILTRILPSINKDDLTKEVNDIMAGNSPP